LAASIVWSLQEPTSLPPVFYTIVASVQGCIRNAHPSDEALAKATGMTVAKIQFYRSEAPTVDVTAPSGNEDLDKLVIQCLNELPPTIVGAPPIKFGFIIPFSWKTDASANPSALPAATSR
jgi:hypothetical protein